MVAERARRPPAVEQRDQPAGIEIALRAEIRQQRDAGPPSAASRIASLLFAAKLPRTGTLTRSRRRPCGSKLQAAGSLSRR